MSNTDDVNVTHADNQPEPAQAMAVAGFLARYCSATRRSYASDLRVFSSWCQDGNLSLLTHPAGLDMRNES